MMSDESKPKESGTHVCLALIEQDSLPRKMLLKIASLIGPVSWEKFLLEAAAELGEGFLLKLLTKLKWLRTPQAGEESHEPGSIKTISKPKIYTISAATQVIPSYPYDRRKYVPMVRLKGSWLKEYGFQIGGKILVHATKDQLIITTGSAMDEALGITSGGGNDG